MLASDVTDTLEQLHARRPDAIGPDPEVHVATLETILSHCAEHPTVYLPSHDRQAALRSRVDTGRRAKAARFAKLDVNSRVDLTRLATERKIEHAPEIALGSRTA
jgi:hypothetical protein